MKRGLLISAITATVLLAGCATTQNTTPNQNIEQVQGPVATKHVETEKMQPAKTLAPSAACNVGNSYSYVVKKGDTLAQLSKEKNVKLSCIEKLNNLKNPNHIKVGQNLLLPQ